MFVGVVAVARPLPRLRIRGRRSALLVFAAGMAAAAVALTLPTREAQAVSARSRLDEFVPAWEFRERHSIRVQAPPQRVHRAVQQVTAEEILLFRALTWIRNPGRSWGAQPDSLLAPPAKRPILEVALGSGFVSLADEPGREVVVGTVVCCRPVPLPGPEAFARLEEPGFAKAGMNFLMTDDGQGGTRLSTETRIHGTDATARRRFAAYWRAIFPGSALMRVMWLRAIKARAEKEGAA